MKCISKSILLFLSIIFIACSNSTNKFTIPAGSNGVVTIFFINDQHGQLENFAKIKHIVAAEKLLNSVILTASGDMFSGNPVVDNHEQKGFPMIDIMNEVGFDIALLGNHEFDYGEAILRDRINQANFDWVCANVDMSASVIPQTEAFKTIEVGALKITFLGLVETEGKQGDIIPLTHPWRVENLTFQKHKNIVSDYSNLKETEQSDLLIALTHIGTYEDRNLASNYSFFDMIIGGHSHQRVDEEVNSIPIFQTGSYLNYLGKVSITVKNKSISEYKFELIDLNNYNEVDADIEQKIADYQASSGLDEVIGYSEQYHDRSMVGCFYTDALRSEMKVDLTFQNTGGVRNSLDEGDISVREIYAIDPFNNGSVKYSMTVYEIKRFLRNTGGIYYSGMDISKAQSEIEIRDLNGNLLSDNATLSIGVNDYIPAVFDNYFPSQRTILPLTTAETIINYLNNTSESVDYPDCNRYFRY